MTRDQVQAWLAAREPTPPAVLAERLRQVVAAAPAAVADAETMAVALGALGHTLLEGVVHCDPQGAGVALDLLAADAFVTYAFEAAAEDGADVGALAEQLLGAVHV